MIWPVGGAVGQRKGKREKEREQVSVRGLQVTVAQQLHAVGTGGAAVRKGGGGREWQHLDSRTKKELGDGCAAVKKRKRRRREEEWVGLRRRQVAIEWRRVVG